MSDVMVTLVGNVATAVEYRESASGGRARFRFAVPSRRWDRQRDGWTDGPTSFFTVWAWRALGANLAASVAVGEPLVVHGRLRVREEEWEGKLRTSVDVDAVAAGHDLTRGTSAFRRVTRTEAQPAGHPAVATTAMAPPPFVPPAVPTTPTASTASTASTVHKAPAPAVPTNPRSSAGPELSVAPDTGVRVSSSAPTIPWVPSASAASPGLVDAAQTDPFGSGPSRPARRTSGRSRATPATATTGSGRKAEAATAQPAAPQAFPGETGTVPGVRSAAPAGIP
ncbi:single-stranded DNA-binding protein [Streptomyces wuyuanensis]|uniref:Single-stranded DNA-binding protein n=1 Tax=Streptomyces wuyuanensis TaxID=1196353 RepID=A0A1G9SM63_9ACTN|nr:Single-stranded DNA-binding protein [Streptomyces wuyuanensis]